MKTRCSVLQKLVFGCWILSSSPLGICVTYKSATLTSSCLRNTPVKKLGSFCFFLSCFQWIGFPGVGLPPVKNGYVSCTERTSCEFELDESEGYICQLDPIFQMGSLVVGLFLLGLPSWSWWHMGGWDWWWNQAATKVVHTKHPVEEVGVLLGFCLLVMRTVTWTSERTVLNQLLSIDGLITFLTARLVLGRAALWFILESETSLELLCSSKLWGLIHFTWSTDKPMVTTINHVFWEL